MPSSSETPTMREIMNTVKLWVDGGMKDDELPVSTEIMENQGRRGLWIPFPPEGHDA